LIFNKKIKDGTEDEAKAVVEFEVEVQSSKIFSIRFL